MARAFATAVKAPCFLMGVLGLVLCKASPCRASIPPHLLSNEDYDTLAKPRQIVLFYPSYQDMGRGQDARLIQVVAPTNSITSADVGRVIPAQRMAESCQSSPTNTNAPVGTTIFGYSMSNYLQSPEVKKSSVGQTANTVQNSMKTEAAFGGSQPGAIKHKVLFNLAPFESKAQMKYKGFTNASLTYNMAVAKLDFEMYRDVDKRTKLVYNHVDTHDDHRDIVSLRWIWW